MLCPYFTYVGFSVKSFYWTGALDISRYIILYFLHYSDNNKVEILEGSFSTKNGIMFSQNAAEVDGISVASKQKLTTTFFPITD
ncbi:MAG: hypothetical protein WBV73_16935 [Phormidium sp.]